MKNDPVMWVLSWLYPREATFNYEIVKVFEDARNSDQINVRLILNIDGQRMNRLLMFSRNLVKNGTILLGFKSISFQSERETVTEDGEPLTLSSGTSSASRETNEQSISPLLFFFLYKPKGACRSGS